ncbi:MAG: ribonuclease Y [Clostridia bacterium]|nr:ribonuclease Y [Clostridia bacterium]
MGAIPCGFLRAAAVYCSTKTYSKNTNFEKEGKQTVDTILWIIAIIVCAVIACFGGYMYRKSMIEKKIDRSEETARRLYDEAVRKADDYKKEKVLEAKEEILKSRASMDAEKASAEREIRDRRAEVQRSENRLMQREASLDKRSDSLDNRESDLKKRSDNLDRKEEEVDRLQEEAEALHQKQTAELERIAAMTQDEAKQIIIERVQKEAFHDAAAQVRDIESRAKEEAEKKARNIIALAIQKCAADHVAESTVSVIALPNDDMKGRIIGREGRNIRALETATGVDLIIDDTPEAVIVSAFDPVRREIARLTVEKLINDGRIHPARIEETVEKARKEVENQIREAGESAVFETNQHGIHHELVKLLGRLKYRTSYGQNVLKHAIEVSHLAGLMAAELGADVQLAKRAGLLHDIGKAVDHEAEGTHVTLGGELARKYHESNDVIHAILAHHNDVEPQTVEAVLVQAADAISAARPGARRESLENYIKRLTKLEEISMSFAGVEKCYAIQSGREVRIMVKPDDVTDEGTKVLAKEIAKRIEKEMEYPGQIRVNVIRETRSMEYAK